MTWVARSGDDRRRGPRRAEDALEHYSVQAIVASACGYVDDLDDRGQHAIEHLDRVIAAVRAYKAAVRLAETARSARREAADTVTVSLGGVTPDDRRHLRCSAGGDSPDGSGCKEPVTTKMHVDGEAIWYGWASCDLRDHQVDVYRRAEADARRRRREAAR